MCNLYSLTKGPQAIRDFVRTTRGDVRNMRGAVVFVGMLLATSVSADSPDISARRLLSSWKDQDPSMRMVAEVIASAFASGLSWSTSLGGKEVCCPPPNLKGPQVMIALEQFVEHNPEMAEKPYGDAMAASLSHAFPCRTQ
jgi:hypothetical protein